MAFCKKCGALLAEDVKFCPACGQAVETPNQEKYSEFKSKINEINNTEDTTQEFDENDINQNKVMAIISYISFLFLIPLFAAKDSKFARFHANQGLVLFICEVVFNAVMRVAGSILNVSILSPLMIPWSIARTAISLIFVALMIVGIVNAANGRAKKLPVIGNITILK